MNLKNTSINQPSFYQDDYDKYRKKVEKEIKLRKDNPLRFKGNLGEIEHLMSKRLDIPANPIQFAFDGTLRQFKQFETVSGPPVIWKNLNKNKNKTLLNTFLPPVTKNSIKNLSNINKYVSRPYEATREVKKKITFSLNFIKTIFPLVYKIINIIKITTLIKYNTLYFVFLLYLII